MARKSNKTDHVLNLLSSGNKKKENDGGIKDKSAPPVQLKKRSNEDSDPEAMESSESGQKQEPDPIETGDSAMSACEAEPESASQFETIETQPATSPISAEAEIPEVSVVQAGSEENPIADAVKDSLEAELDAYLKEEEEGHAASFLEEKENTTRGADAETSTDLPDLPEGSEYRSDPNLESDLPDLPDYMPNGQEVTPVGSEQNPDIADQVPASPESAEKREDDLPNHVINAAAEVMNRQEPTAQQPAKESKVQEQIISETTAVPKPVQPQQTQAEIPVKQVQSVKEAEPQVQQKSADSKHTEVDAGEEVDYEMVNVMEHLVREQAPKYIRQFGHCDCRRCIEDTVALALTHLPPKYVVVNKAAASPLLNFYEKRFAGQLIVEITKASMVIHENPHH